MKISDPLRFIDWDIHKFLGTVLTVQLAMLVLIILETSGIQVPVLRSLVCFIYLTFIPGALILRAMGVRKLGPIESTLFTVGASLATLMFAGALLNFVGLYIGLKQPISLLPITFVLVVLVIVLSVVCYLRDKKSGDAPMVDIGKALSPTALLLIILPLLTVLGAYTMNTSGDNRLLALMILCLAAIVLLVGFDRLIPKELYPLIIFVMAVSLVLHDSLISSYINGWDIQKENYLASLVVTSGFWNASLFNVLNAMLSIVMLVPIYSILMNIDTVWVLKLVYPLLFALVPLGLYEVFRRQSNEKIAFMASFFFTSLVVFYTEMIQLARQEIAELFLVLLILLIIERNMDKVKWSALFIIFSFSLVVSHYGLTYIFIASLAIVWLLMFLGRKLHIRGLDDASPNRGLTAPLVLLLVAFCLVWYSTIAGGNAFLTILVIMRQINGALLTSFMNPDAVQGMAIIGTAGSVSLLHRLYVYLMLFTQAVVVIGVIALLIRGDLARIAKEYYAFSVAMVLLLVAGVTVPFFASALNTTRLYQIALIFLAIFFVIGWLSLSKLLGRFTRRTGAVTSFAFATLGIFLAIFLLFNTGLVFEITKDVPTSTSLNNSIDTSEYNYAEVAGADWIVSERNSSVINNTTGSYYLPPIYIDALRSILVLNADQAAGFPDNASHMFQNSYVYLGTYNILKDQVLTATAIGTGTQSSDIYINATPLLEGRDRIYSSGGAEIYRSYPR